MAWSLGWLAYEWTLLLPGHLAIQVMVSVPAQLPRNGTIGRVSMLFLKGKEKIGQVMWGWEEGRVNARQNITRQARTLQEKRAGYLVTWDVSEETGGFPGGTSGKGPACWCRRHKRLGFNPWVGKISWRRKCQPTPVFSPGESHGKRNLV